MLEVLKRERTSGMAETFTMSMREMDRLRMIIRIEEKKLTVGEAAESLHLGERQMYRILSRHRSEGDAGIIHQRRGKVSPRRSEPDQMFRPDVRCKDRSADDEPSHFPPCEEIRIGCFLLLSRNPPHDTENKPEVPGNHYPIKRL